MILETLHRACDALQGPILLYFLLLNGTYLLLNLISLREVRRYMQRRGGQLDLSHQTGFEPPVSIVMPVHNEQDLVVASVGALLQLNYPDYEVIVVNDGSTDRTLDVLIEEFGLLRFPSAYRARLACKPVRGIYRSRIHPNLQVIDKENGRKADANNAGINAARHPLFLCTDGDSILDRNSLLRVVQPFLEDPRTVAVGGTVRIANGCSAASGIMSRIGIAPNWLVPLQIVEYLRAFLYGRIGWSRMGGLMILSGAFGLFHTETVVQAGGYRTDALGEDADLTMRLHLYLRRIGRPYRICQVPEPICWTEVPENLGSLARQRIRWQRGLWDALWKNRQLLFRPNGGVPGWIAFPFLVVFEWAGPIIEVFGYLALGIAFALGVLDPTGFAVFLAVAIGLGVLLSTTALLIEEISFHMYPRYGHVGLLLFAAVAENFGYRQINTIWRLVGILESAVGKKTTWGAMRRSGAWAKAA